MLTETGISFSNTEDSVLNPSEKLHLPPLIKKSLASYGTQRFLKKRVHKSLPMGPNLAHIRNLYFMKIHIRGVFNNLST